jgi:serine/threonine-protein kinase
VDGRDGRPAPGAGGLGPVDPADELSAALDPPPRRRGRAGRWAVAILLIVALGTLGVLAVSVLRGQGTPQLFPVGDYRGQQLDAVQASLPEGADWRIDRRDARRDDTDPGEVLDQSPPAGGRLEEGGALQLTVSQGDELRTVPDVSGSSVEEAARQLGGLGLVLAQPSRDQWSETAPAGTVLDVVEKGQQLPKAAHVTLVVSKGPEPRTVPQVSGGPDAASAALSALGLTVATVQDYSETVTAGQVIGTDPPAGTQVGKGSPVNVVVSAGRRPVPVPDVVGKSASDASDALEDAGLVVRTDGAANKPVIATDPAAGTQLHLGDQVIIITQRS